MTNHASNDESEREKSRVAWGFSVAFHGILFGLLWYAMQSWPEGSAAETGTGSIGIVLRHVGDDGDVRDGDEGQGETPRTLTQTPEPPPLVAAPVPEVTITEIPREEPRRLAAKFTAAPVAQPANEPTDGRADAGGLGRSGVPGGTGYGKTSVFGVEGHGNKFVYLFDRSASMEGPPLSAAKRQLLESLQSLDNVQQFQIMFFNTKTRVFDSSGGGRRIAFASDRNKQLAANFVGGITSDGGTDRIIALREAINLSPNVIFFLTDADDPMSANELAEIARLNKRAQAAICVIEFGRRPTPPTDNFLMQLARESGGKYGYVDTARLKK